MIWDAPIRAGQAASGFVGGWAGDRGNELKENFGFYDKNSDTPYGRAARAAEAGDRRGLESALGEFNPVGGDARRQKEQWEGRLSELSKESVRKEQREQIERMYGKIPDDKGFLSELEDRRNANAAAMMRGQIEGQRALANTTGQWDYKGRQLDAGTQRYVADTNFRVADITSARGLEGTKYTADKQLQGVDISSMRQLLGVKDTNQAARHGQLVGERTERARDLLQSMAGNRGTTANFIIGAGARSSFARR